MGEIPRIHVEQKRRQARGRSGLLNNVLIVGAFDTLETTPQLFIDITDAQEALGTDPSYNGCKVLPILFTSGTLLAVNTTTETTTGEGSSAVTTREKTVTTEKLAAALAKVKGEDFDSVFIAESLSDEALVILTTFLEEMHEMKLPAGYINGISRANNSDYITTAGLTGEHCYGLLTQNLTVNGTDYDLLESAAYYASVINNMHPGNGMTNKEVPNVTGITPEYSFEDNGAGKALVGAGLTILKAQSRRSSKYIVVNSEQPNGLALYINRVRNYVIKEMALHPFLGDRNRDPTHEEVIQELDRVKYKCIDTMDLLKDITYTAEKKGPKTLDVNIVSMDFDDEITYINLYYTINVV